MKFIRKEKLKMTNKEFSEKDQVFIKSCELAETKPTTRQASKFRMGKGKAFKYKNKAITLCSS